MQSSSITDMKNIDLATVDRDELVDIRDVKVNTALPKRERAIGMSLLKTDKSSASFSEDSFSLFS